MLVVPPYIIRGVARPRGGSSEVTGLGDNPGLSCTAGSSADFAFYIPLAWTIVTTTQRIQHPRRLVGVQDGMSGWLAAVLWILFIPAYVVVYLISYLHGLVSVVSWLTIVFRGYQPAGVHNALTFTNGYLARAHGYLGLLTDTYPPVGAEGPQVGDAPPAAIAPTAPPPAVASPGSRSPTPPEQPPAAS